MALYSNVCELLNGHVANGAAKLFSFSVGKLKMLHEGLPGLYEDRTTVAEDEGDSDDVVIDISSFPASLGEGLSEMEKKKRVRKERGLRNLDLPS